MMRRMASVQSGDGAGHANATLPVLVTASSAMPTGPQSRARRSAATCRSP